MPYPITPNNFRLNQNAINKALMNMIISQQVFDSDVASTDLADRFKVDGTLFGDTKLYHSFDIGSPENWLNDEEAQDLLKLNRNKSGKTQSIVMDVYKIISITTDQYLSKQAFMKEGTFAEFTSYLKGSLRKIKRVYDRSLINVKLGTLEPSTSRCDIQLETPLGATQEETNRLSAQNLAAKLMVLKTELEDNNRDFNKLGYLRSYSPEKLIAVWNVEQHAKITKLDLPSIFHKDIEAEGGFSQYDLPAKWFGKDVEYTAETDYTEIDKWTGGQLRFKESGWYLINTAGSVSVITMVDKPSDNAFYFWAGDKVPVNGTSYVDHVRNKTVTCNIDDIYSLYVYEEDPTIAFVLVDEESLPFMSGFETSTEFFNGRSLTNTNFLIFGHNTMEYLEEFPRIKVRIEVAETQTFGGAQKVTVSGIPDVNIKQVGGVTTPTMGGSLKVSVQSVGGDGTIPVNIALVKGATLSGPEIPVDVTKVGSQTVITTSGELPVNVAQVGGEDVQEYQESTGEVVITKFTPAP